MRQPRSTWLALVGLLALIYVGLDAPDPSVPATPEPARAMADGAAGVVLAAPVDDEIAASAADVAPSTREIDAARWLTRARAVQASTRARLGVSDGATCAEATYVSFRRSDAQTDVSDQWYVASQLWADAELIRATSELARRASRQADGTEPAHDLSDPVTVADARCRLAKGFNFLDRLHDGGGYLARAAPDGTNVAAGLHYADDNALTGLSLLAAADVESDPAVRQRYVRSARAVAEFLTTSGLWDEVFGGGFWWNSNKGDRWEGKPAQSNALAALFFARLAAATGDAADRDRAVRTLDWMDTLLYDPDRQLYRWSARYEDMKARTGGPILYSRYFNYDQAIALEAQIEVARLDGRTERLERARAIGRVMHAGLWNATHGGYTLETGADRIYASYGAWSSLGHLALYDLDGDPAWLEMARQNADALDAMFRHIDGGYGFRHFRCITPVERSRPGCEGGEAAWVRDQALDGAAQAWMQHLQAALARRLAAGAPALIEPAQPASAPDRPAYRAIRPALTGRSARQASLGLPSDTR